MFFNFIHSLEELQAGFPVGKLAFKRGKIKGITLLLSGKQPI